MSAAYVHSERMDVRHIMDNMKAALIRSVRLEVGSNRAPLCFIILYLAKPSTVSPHHPHHPHQLPYTMKLLLSLAIAAVAAPTTDSRVDLPRLDGADGYVLDIKGGIRDVNGGVVVGVMTASSIPGLSKPVMHTTTDADITNLAKIDWTKII